VLYVKKDETHEEPAKAAHDDKKAHDKTHDEKPKDKDAKDHKHKDKHDKFEKHGDSKPKEEEKADNSITYEEYVKTVKVGTSEINEKNAGKTKESLLAELGKSELLETKKTKTNWW